MAERRMKFIIKKNGGGAFTVETKDGFVGAQCENEVETFIGAIGAKVVNSGDKDERYYNKDIDTFVDRLE